jgi:aryl-alcohol dehydrogenase-like predicted oxidoreductase
MPISWMSNQRFRAKVRNLLNRRRMEQEYAPLYGKIGIGLTTFSPLASGLLTGKYAKQLPEGSRLARSDMAWLRDRTLLPEKIAAAERAAETARALGCTPAQLAVAWCLKNPRVISVILGATSPEQLRETLVAPHVAAKLTPADMARLRLEALNCPLRGSRSARRVSRHAEAAP